MFFLSVFFTSPQVLQAQSRCSSLELSNHVPHLSLGAAGAEQVQFAGAAAGEGAAEGRESGDADGQRAPAAGGPAGARAGCWQAAAAGPQPGQGRLLAGSPCFCLLSWAGLWALCPQPNLIFTEQRAAGLSKDRETETHKPLLFTVCDFEFLCLMEEYSYMV